MKHLSVLVAAAAFATGLASAVARADVSVDPPHTSVAFSVKHLTLTTVSGTIGVKSASIGVGADDVLTSAVATLDLSTIDTKVGDRDNDLRSDHWFDVAKYPLLTFKSTKIGGDKNAMKVTGDLTFHGITNPVTLDAKYEGSVKDDKGRTHRGYSATGVIDRTKWNLGNNYPAIVVGNDVTITINLEAVSS